MKERTVRVMWKAGLVVLALAAVLGGSVAQAAAKPTMKVVGFAAILRNNDHKVFAKSGGVLTRCDEPGAFSVVLDVSNIIGGQAYQAVWKRAGKVVYTHAGKSGAFDAKPDRIQLGWSKVLPLPNGVYTFQMSVGGAVISKATVTRSCA